MMSTLSMMVCMLILIMLFANVHGDVHVVHVYAHHDRYDGWVDAENFKTLPQLVTEI